MGFMMCCRNCPTSPVPTSPRVRRPGPWSTAYSESLEALTYAAGSFDLILTSETLEHVPDLARALCELRRVLVPGGRHVFTIPVLPNVARTFARATLQPDGSIVEHATRICHPGATQAIRSSPSSAPISRTFSTRPALGRGPLRAGERRRARPGLRDEPIGRRGRRGRPSELTTPGLLGRRRTRRAGVDEPGGRAFRQGPPPGPPGHLGPSERA
ncbi:MAG: class I SAM-dependent methyltransferase [Isosphaeraceae bacterium]